MRNKIYWIIITLLSLFLFFFCIRYVSIRIIEMSQRGYLIAFYEVTNLDDSYNSIVSSFAYFFKNFWSQLKSFGKGIYSLFTSLTFWIWISILLPFIFIIKILFYIWINGKNKKYKVSLGARILNSLVSFIVKEIRLLFDFVKKKSKRIVILICSGFGLLFLFETIIFIIIYLISMFNLTSYLVLFSMLKFILVKIIDFVLNGNKFVLSFILIIAYLKVVEHLAFKKCNRNWACFKRLIANSATVNVIDGEPGAGKTLTLSQAALASTENFLDEYEKAMTEFEIKYPNFNFAKIRLLLKIFYLDFKLEELDNVIKSAPNILFDLFRLYDYVNSEVSRMFFNEYYRGTNIVGLIPINDPYYSSFCRIGSVDSMRFFKKLDSFPYEPDMTLIFPEYDKEFNSHDDKKTVGDDGTFAFFALLSHLLERHGSAWLDGQDKDQGIKRIRGVAGGYYHLEKKKVCMPFLIQVIYKPILWFYNRLLKLVLAYLGYRPKTEKKWTSRRKQVVYKKNNVGFLYQLIKYVIFVLNKIVSHFEKFQYFKIYAEYATNDEFRNSKMIHYSLNVMDFDHEGNLIYNSTPFKKFYDDLKGVLYKEKGIKQNLLMLETWTSLEPDLIEYSKTGLRNYSKIVQAQFDSEESKDV